MSRRALTLVVALVVAAVWVPSLRNGFVWDDQYDIIRSDRLHHARAIGDVFLHHAMWSADQPETAIATYRPLALATLAVDYQVWKLRPAGYHATNVLLHVLATLAVLLALSVLVADFRWAAALALLFALHPANAEAVAWINGRSEMLALGFGALAVWAAATRRFVVLGVALLAALLGKETAALFIPVTLAVTFVLRGEGRDRRAMVPALCAAIVAAAAYAGLRGYALGHTALPSHAGAVATLGPVWSRATFAALVPWRSGPIELSTWLASLSTGARVAWAFGGALLAALALTLAARRRWLPAIGLGWWLLAIAPTAAIAALDYPWPGLARWLYIGLPGLLLVVYAAARRLPERVRLAAFTVAAMLFAFASQRAIAAWHDDEALYSAMTSESPDDAWAWRALGTVRLAQARYTDAADCFHSAARFDRTEEIHAAFALEAYAWTFLDRCDEASAQFHAHPVTPALKSEDFDVAEAACRKRLTAKTRRVKSAHANEEIGAAASTKR
ncbi:MAG: hypothetical protein JWN44_6005 [Myxococcales bacterium]|nr:hypothetical protein [Myxococcales bacterium]